MLDHVFLSVSDIERSIAFYAQALAPLGIADRVEYDGKDGPPYGPRQTSRTRDCFAPRFHGSPLLVRMYPLVRRDLLRLGQFSAGSE